MSTRAPQPELDDVVALVSLGDAFRRAADAYGEARRIVFDVYPAGVPGPAALSAAQQAALDELHRAEADLDRLRRVLHGTPERL
jgi:hypothetical protein